MSRGFQKREARAWVYGVLEGASFVACGHDRPTIAVELLVRTLALRMRVPTAGTIRRIARDAAILFPRGFWREYEDWRRDFLDGD